MLNVRYCINLCIGCSFSSKYCPKIGVRLIHAIGAFGNIFLQFRGCVSYTRATYTQVFMVCNTLHVKRNSVSLLKLQTLQKSVQSLLCKLVQKDNWNLSFWKFEISWNILTSTIFTNTGLIQSTPRSLQWCPLRCFSVNKMIQSVTRMLWRSTMSIRKNSGLNRSMSSSFNTRMKNGIVSSFLLGLIKKYYCLHVFYAIICNLSAFWMNR